MFGRDDRVKSEWTKYLGKVLYGPVTPGADHYQGQEHYLVELVDGPKKGTAALWPTHVMSPGPKFEAGQKVTFQYSPEGEAFEVLAGPFKDFEGDVFWVVRSSKGADDMAYETHMLPVVE